MSVWKSFAAAAAIAAGGFPGTAAAQAVDITIMTSYGPNQSRGQVLQELVDQFNAEHEGGIAVELQVDPDHPAMQAKLRTMIAAGAPPDISHYNFNPNDLAIPTSGELLDFSRYMDDAWRSRFNEGDLERFTFDGALVSLPFQQSPALLYYNKDLFQKAGIGSFPKTWNELLAACDALQGIEVGCISMFTKNDAWHISGPLTYAAACIGGLDVFSGDLDRDAVVQALTIVNELIDKSTRDVVGASYDVSSKNFLLGRTAMVVDGPWAIGPMNDQFQNDEVGIAPAPTCENAQAPEGFIVTDAPSPMLAGKQGDQAKADAIVEWFRFFTSPESARRFGEEGSQPVAFAQEVDADKVNPLFSNYLSVSADVPGKVISLHRVLRPSAQTALPSILEAMAIGQITPEEAATQLQAANTR